VKEKLIKKENHQEGVGGSLVGVRMLNPPEKFAPAIIETKRISPNEHSTFSH
jgi:hypothetical protein